MSIFEPDDIPKPNIVPISAGTNNMINEASARSAQSQGSLSDESFNPAAAAAKQTYGDDSGTQSEESRRGGLMDPNMISAIRAKQGQMLGQNLTSQKQNSEMNAFEQRRQNLNFAQNALVARQRFQNANYERLLQATNNENEIRANVMKGWMGAVGTVVGGIAGSAAGPMGTVAGAQLGSMLGGKQGSVSEIGGADVTMPKGGRSYSGGVTQNDFMGSGYGNSGGGGYS